MKAVSSTAVACLVNQSTREGDTLAPVSSRLTKLASYPRAPLPSPKLHRLHRAQYVAAVARFISAASELRDATGWCAP